MSTAICVEFLSTDYEKMFPSFYRSMNIQVAGLRFKNIEPDCWNTTNVTCKLEDSIIFFNQSETQFTNRKVVFSHKYHNYTEQNITKNLNIAKSVMYQRYLDSLLQNFNKLFKYKKEHFPNLLSFTKKKYDDGWEFMERDIRYIPENKNYTLIKTCLPTNDELSGLKDFETCEKGQQPLFLVTGSFSYQSQNFPKLILEIIQTNELHYFIFSLLIKLVVAFTFVAFVYCWSTRNVIRPLKAVNKHVNSMGNEEEDPTSIQ